MGDVAVARAFDRLLSLGGEWQGEQQLASSPWMPAGVAEASVAFRAVAGGTALAQDQRSWRGDETLLSGHGVLTVDPESADVLWFWFDSAGFQATGPGRGTWDGADLCLERRSPRGVNRTSLGVHGDELHEHIAFRAAGAATFTTLATGTYRRSRAVRGSRRRSEASWPTR
jgi:hypothetical protein